MASDLSYNPAQAAQRPQPPQAQYPQDPYAQYPQDPYAQYPQDPYAQRPQDPYAQRPQDPYAQRPQDPYVQRQQAEQPQPQHPLGIDPGIWPLIRETAARLSRNQDAFIQQLHDDLTGLMPRSAAESLRVDMWVFCERMVHLLLWVALTDQPLGVVAEELRKAGAQNWVEGFPATQYESVAHALVQTVHYLSLLDWSASAGSAWISYFIWVKPHLLAGAEQAAAQYAAAQQAAEREAAAQRAAADREAARVQALSRDPRGRHTQVAGDVNLESVGSLLDDEDAENTGYGQIMVSMTRNQRRQPRGARDR